MVQVDMFDLIDEGFCFDQDINNIVDMLDEIAEKHEMVTKTEKEWEIWDNGPDLGYRLFYTIYFKEYLPDEAYRELEEIITYADTKKIELVPLVPFALGDTGHIHITSRFLDERRKIK